MLFLFVIIQLSARQNGKCLSAGPVTTLTNGVCSCAIAAGPLGSQEWKLPGTQGKRDLKLLGSGKSHSLGDRCHAYQCSCILSIDF